MTNEQLAMLLKGQIDRLKVIVDELKNNQAELAYRDLRVYVSDLQSDRERLIRSGYHQ